MALSAQAGLQSAQAMALSAQAGPPSAQVRSLVVENPSDRKSGCKLTSGLRLPFILVGHKAFISLQQFFQTT